MPTTGGADTATMKLVVKTTGPNSRDTHLTPSSATWAETLTADQAHSRHLRPAPDDDVLDRYDERRDAEHPVTIDVDALIKNPTANFGWRIDDEGSTALANMTTFNTVEAGHDELRPQLVINYEK